MNVSTWRQRRACVQTNTSQDSTQSQAPCPPPLGHPGPAFLAHFLPEGLGDQPGAGVRVEDAHLGSQTPPPLRWGQVKVAYQSHIHMFPHPPL